MKMRTFSLEMRENVHISKDPYPQGKLSDSGGSRISHRVCTNLVGGGANSRGGYISKNLYVKTKESGPLGGARAGGTPSGSATDLVLSFWHTTFLKDRVGAPLRGFRRIIMFKWEKSPGNDWSTLALKPMDRINQSPKQRVPVGPQKWQLVTAKI